jgi:hypothetical protein
MTDTPGTPGTAHAREEEDARAPEVDVFLQALAATGNVAASCRASGLGRTTVYRYKEQDEAFAAAWKEALEEACDDLELEARRRGKDGVLTPVYYKGKIVGHIREYSDTLLLSQLKAHCPQLYRDRVVKQEVSGSVRLEHVLSDALAKAEEARRALAR